jgi:hypothetical protein
MVKNSRPPETLIFQTALLLNEKKASLPMAHILHTDYACFQTASLTPAKSLTKTNAIVNRTHPALSKQTI